MGQREIQVEHLLLGLLSHDSGLALRSAHRFGMGEPGPEHILVALIGRGEGGSSEILRALGADPPTVRFEAKKLISFAGIAGPVVGQGGWCAARLALDR